MTIRELAEIFDVSEKVVSAWAMEDGFPRAVHGGTGLELRYNSADVVAWSIARSIRLRHLH